MAGSGAWGATLPADRPLDNAFLISEALQEATNASGPAKSGAAPAGVAPSSAASSSAASFVAGPSGAARNQLARYDLQALQAVSNDPNIKEQIAAAWAASNPNGPDRAEQGFWICRDPDTGLLYTRPFTSADGPRHMIPGMPSSYAIAFFHTHPFPGAARQGPSDLDERFAVLWNLSGIIQSRIGLFYFGPSLKLWQPR